MGIKGLWSEVKPVCRPSHLSNFRGQRVGVDMYVWLHRGMIGTVELRGDSDVGCFVESSAEEAIRLNTRFLHFVISRVELMLRCGIHPVLVFDGASIPVKRGTDEERRSNRAARLAEALRLLKEAPTSCPSARREAAQLIEKGMDVSTELAHAVIQVLQERRLECIVSPFEADAQLAFLCKEGFVQAVISEDSDLIAYQCPCLIAKLDGHGNCEVFSAQDLPRCPSFHGLSYESFLVGCILSGCDYLPSLRHIGVKKAFRLVAQATSVPSLLHTLEVKFGFSREELNVYREKLQQAYYCFAHHLVFDPARREVVHLTPLPAGISLNSDLLGELVPKEMAMKVCGECLYDPTTMSLYKGTYQYCVQQYWRQTKKGQTSLNAFNGFQDAHAPRVMLVVGGGSDNNGGRISTSTPTATNTPTTTTTTFFTSPLQKVQEATGFCGTTTAWTRPVVRSKYFTQNRWKLEDWESSNTPDAATTTTASGPPTQDDAFPLNGMLDTQLAPNASSPIHTTEEEANPSHPARVCPSDGLSSLSPPGAAPGTQRAAVSESAPNSDSHSQESVSARETRCPFGYAQCGRRHSIFEQCFQGKDWTRDAAPQTAPTVGTKHPRGGSAGETTRSSPPLFQPTYRPPALGETGEQTGRQRVMLTGRRALSSSTARAMEIMHRWTVGDSGSEGVGADAEEESGKPSLCGNTKAALLFEKLEFARR